MSNLLHIRDEKENEIEKYHCRWNNPKLASIINSEYFIEIWTENSVYNDSNDFPNVLFVLWIVHYIKRNSRSIEVWHKKK